MYETLFGNKTVEKVLLFLFVNNKCYGTQLHHQLKTPLTPIQKTLLRLEKGGVILSYYEGKTRFYQFNPAYPLLHELEQLLKKAYTLLSAHDKKAYYVPKDHALQPVVMKNKPRILLALWERLSNVNQLTFSARTRSKEHLGWHGNGKGEVSVTKSGPSILIFNEKGTWQARQGSEVNFTNAFRWTLDRDAGMISLEHLRRGVDQPVFLFHLAPSGDQSLASVDSHLCEGDTYFGQINFDRYSLRLSWRVIGPKKNEELDYYYS